MTTATTTRKKRDLSLWATQHEVIETGRQTIVVSRVPILTTGIVVFTAWVPSGLMANHSTITRFEEIDPNTWFGKIGTERLTAELDALPAYSDERMEAVKEFHGKQYEFAYSAMAESKFAAELAGAKFHNGEAEIIDPQLTAELDRTRRNIAERRAAGE